ncbi:MAG: hypothetical protein FJX56_01470 [Alphaproteobacteria bacterium]|nr:hypothetical protein [Alphaproteobacteria bacterium]
MKAAITCQRETLAILGMRIYIALVGTLLGFIMYFTVIKRIGPGRGAYINVLIPLVALIVSTLFEDFSCTPISLAGAALILLGNLLVIRPPRPALAPA